MATYTQFPNVGYVQHEFTDKQLAKVREEVKTIQDDFSKATDAHAKLAGNIEKEFTLSDKTKLYLEYILMPMVRTMYEGSPEYIKKGSHSQRMPAFYLESVWVNFQKKHEFNPLHGHTGVYSWVIWLQVPFTNEEELKAGPGNGSNHPVSGQFAFNYIDSSGTIINHGLQVDKSWENKAILFPSSTMHCVYPFYSSDDYRISISGNFYLKETGHGQQRR
jgi:hypothetical protein